MLILVRHGESVANAQGLLLGRTDAELTDAGRAFLPHAEALLASMRDGVEAVGALSGTTRGTVALAVVGTLASTTLTERLRGFRAAHPEVDLRLRTALSAEVSALATSVGLVMAPRSMKYTAPAKSSRRA